MRFLAFFTIPRETLLLLNLTRPFSTLHPLPPDLPSHLFTLLSHPNWHHHPSLPHLLPLITPFHVSSLLHLKPSPQTALQFFNWVATKPGYKHTPFAYASLLNLLVPHGFLRPAETARISMVKAAGSPDDARFVLAFLRGLNLNCDEKFRFKLSVKCYNLMLMLLSRFELVDEMKGLYVDMLSDTVLPNMYTFNTMVNGYCKLGNLSEASVYVSEIVQAGFALDTFTYTSLILGHCRSRNVDGACCVFGLMWRKGCPRNEVSYTNLIHGLCEAGRIGEALKLFLHMEEDNCSPTVRTFTVLICALCEAGRKLEAMNLFREMSGRGCEPNAHTYTVLIDSSSKERNFDDARKLLDQMLEKGLVPGVVTYNALIDGYCKVGKNSEALEILGLMDSNNCSPNSRTYNELICGFWQEALSLVDEMIKVNLKPTVETYTNLIAEMLKEGDINHANKTLNQMISSGCQPDVFAYTTFVHAYCSQGRLEEAENVMTKMKEEGIVPDSLAYTFLIDGYGCMQLLECSFDVLKRMFDAACEPSHHTYGFLLKHLVKETLTIKDGCIVEGSFAQGFVSNDLINVWKTLDFDIVSLLFKKMVEHGCKPNVNTYSKLITGLCRVGRLNVALKLLNDLQEGGMSPSELIYNELLRCCCELKLYEEALSLLYDMNKNGHLAHLESYKLLICGLCDEGKKAMAESVFHTLLCCQYNYDEVAWKVLIDGLLKNGYNDECSMFLKSMEKKGCQLHPQTYALLIEGT
ncbi:Pentatricopeptide repeat-containing protein [Vigna angularis]|uniref:Pentatricopeptide repeat-containing protein n=1 Tax=Phaseolus angularis TaxID=3914 RepID=A0A8T0KZ07_PHAAN|nr:Pentatricopeptide repeat-containing protein [Vigna angularis]